MCADLTKLNPSSEEFIVEVASRRDEAEAWLCANVKMSLVVPRDKMKALWPSGMSLGGSTFTDKDGQLKKTACNVAPVVEKVCPGAEIEGCEVSGNFLYIHLVADDKKNKEK